MNESIKTNAVPAAFVPPTSAHAPLGQYLTFTLGDESFGVSIIGIKEIMECSVFTQVPMMPDVIRGVINLRGHVVPVMDLSARLGGDFTTVSRRTCIIIVDAQDVAEQESRHIGLMVDAINAVIDLGAEDIEPAPSCGSLSRPRFISGMARRGEHFTVLLDIERLLALDVDVNVEAALPAIAV